ncbi:MAG TPA: ATPase domain-containing protein [Stellaceae bacterium]|nr:ATPase domain-containing protein [Stellaceae bacterium]
MAQDPAEPEERLSTGSPELDRILNGGLVRHRLYLVEGTAGTGKTTLALQFAIEGAAQGEKTLYITLAETAEELNAAARSHGWSLDPIEVYELVPLEARIDRQQTVLQPSEVELGETMQLVCERIEAAAPDRLVIDSLSELRLLARDPLRFRRQILALKAFLSGRRCTTLVLDDLTVLPNGLQMHSIVHGVLSLEQRHRGYGAVRRRLHVLKMRGSPFQSGHHDFLIAPGRICVFPSLIAEEGDGAFPPETVSSGLPELDSLLGGGLARGTVTMLIGPSGSGKSSLALQYAMAAVGREESAAIFAFDETFATFAERSVGLGFDVRAAVAGGHMAWEEVQPTRISPGEFVWRVRRQVEDRGVRLVVIDSLNSYLAAMPEEQMLMLQMHELLKYLDGSGVTTLLVMAQHGLAGEPHAPVDLSFLSDAIVLLRLFEAGGEVRKAISVVKKRSGVHETAIREYRLTAEGIRVGPVLPDFSGLLSGTPATLAQGAPVPQPGGSDAD